MNGPAHTVVAFGRTGLLDLWVLIRRRGGDMVRITIPLVGTDGDDLAEVIDLALQRLPERPGPDVY